MPVDWGVVLWTGRRFRLKKELHVAEKVGDQEVSRIIPAGEVIEVTDGPRPDPTRVVEIRWRNRRFVAFAVDVAARGEDVAQSGIA